MTTVWIFGDSFADVGFCANHPNNDLTWMQQVSIKLNYDARYLGKGGTSLEYTYEQFNAVRNQINQYDVIVIALTCINRRWFIRENITDNIWKLMTDPYLKTAIEYYMTSFNNNNIYETYLENFLYNLDYVTNTLNTKTIILPCFETTQIPKNLNFHVADLCLYNISKQEFKMNLCDDYMQKMNGVDLRACHLIKSNHSILADKICDYIMHNNPINQDAFKTDIVDYNTLKDIQFAQDELFSVHLMPEYQTHITNL